MTTSKAGLDLIKSDESFVPKLYDCPAGDATVGYGHLVHHGLVCGAASEAPFAHGVTQEQGTALLMIDVGYAEHAIASLVKVPLSQGQYDALVSFTFNMGAGRLQSSTLLRVLNLRQYTAAAGQFAAWVMGGGVKLPGLVIRRAAERALFIAA
jgi:lysozyme